MPKFCNFLIDSTIADLGESQGSFGLSFMLNIDGFASHCNCVSGLLIAVWRFPEKRSQAQPP